MSLREMFKLSSAVCRATIKACCTYCKGARTFGQFSAVELSRFELNGDDMSERLVQQFDGHAESCGGHFGVGEGGGCTKRGLSVSVQGAGPDTVPDPELSRQSPKHD